MPQFSPRMFWLELPELTPISTFRGHPPESNFPQNRCISAESTYCNAKTASLSNRRREAAPGFKVKHARRRPQTASLSGCEPDNFPPYRGRNTAISGVGLSFRLKQGSVFL